MHFLQAACWLVQRNDSTSRSRHPSMNLKSLDYTRPAEVHWRNPTPHLPSLGHHRRKFATLINAIRFVMEDLTDFPQSTASIYTEGGNLTFVQISAAYSDKIIPAVPQSSAGP